MHELANDIVVAELIEVSVCSTQGCLCNNADLLLATEPINAAYDFFTEGAGFATFGFAMAVVGLIWPFFTSIFGWINFTSITFFIILN
jgi:hypothetical protein